MALTGNVEVADRAPKKLNNMLLAQYFTFYEKH
jgi:hypothetical protein